jgi:hypothetical protein
MPSSPDLLHHALQLLKTAGHCPVPHASGKNAS